MHLNYLNYLNIIVLRYPGMSSIAPNKSQSHNCQNSTDIHMFISFITILVSIFSLYKIAAETILGNQSASGRGGYQSLINLTKNEDLNCDSKTMNHKYIG